MSDYENTLEDLGIPGHSFDDFLDEESNEATEYVPLADSEHEERLYNDPPSPHPDETRTLTLYGAMLFAVEAALKRLQGYDLTSKAEAFRTFLSDYYNDLIA